MKRAWLLFALAGCKPAAPVAPEAAYRAFVEAAAQARVDPKAQQAFLDSFDAPTRNALIERAHAASQAAGKDVLRDAPVEQLFAGPGSAAPVTDVQVVSQTGNEAVLRVSTDAGGDARVKLVREDGRWKVHLDALARDGG